MMVTPNFGVSELAVMSGQIDSRELAIYLHRASAIVYSMCIVPLSCSAPLTKALTLLIMTRSNVAPAIKLIIHKLLALENSYHIRWELFSVIIPREVLISTFAI
jgi:hypothetical protein